MNSGSIIVPYLLIFTDLRWTKIATEAKVSVFTVSMIICISYRKERENYQELIRNNKCPYVHLPCFHWKFLVVFSTCIKLGTVQSFAKLRLEHYMFICNKSFYFFFFYWNMTRETRSDHIQNLTQQLFQRVRYMNQRRHHDTDSLCILGDSISRKITCIYGITKSFWVEQYEHIKLSYVLVKHWPLVFNSTCCLSRLITRKEPSAVNVVSVRYGNEGLAWFARQDKTELLYLTSRGR